MNDPSTGAGDQPTIGSFSLPGKTIVCYQQLHAINNGGDVTVALAELAKQLDVSITTVGKHITRLEQAGAVTVHRNGKRISTYQLHADPTDDSDNDDELVSIGGALAMYGLSVRASALRMPISVAALGCYMRLIDLNEIHYHEPFPLTLNELADLFGVDDREQARLWLLELWCVDMVDIQMIDNNRTALIKVDTAPELSISEAKRRLIEMRADLDNEGDAR